MCTLQSPFLGVKQAAMYTCGAVRVGGNHLGYLVLLLWYTNAPPYRCCTLIKLLWARVYSSVLLIFERDLTMDALYTGEWS